MAEEVTLHAVIDENVYMEHSNPKETKMKIRMTALMSLKDFEKLMAKADDGLVLLEVK